MVVMPLVLIRHVGLVVLGVFISTKELEERRRLSRLLTFVEIDKCQETMCLASERILRSRGGDDLGALKMFASVDIFVLAKARRGLFA
jgi:hypothetical protein